MIDVRVIIDPFERRIESHRINWAAQTPEQLVAQLCSGWSVPVDVYVAGRKIREEEYTRTLANAVSVVIAPRMGAQVVALVAKAIIVAIIAALVGLAIAALFPPTLPEIRRREEDSQTLGFSGMVTDYVPLGPIPVSYGEAEVPGTVIETELSDFFTAVVCLGHGRIESIGGVVPIGGVAENLSGAGLPQNLRVNGASLLPVEDGTLVSFRTGFPGQPPFDGIRTGTFIAGAGNLDDFNSAASVEIVNSVDRVVALLQFPQGLYRVDVAGDPVPLPNPIGFDVRVTKAGRVVASEEIFVGSRPGNVRDAFVVPIDVAVPAFVTPAFTVTLRRTQAKGPLTEQSSANFLGVNAANILRLSYPSLVVVQIRLPLTETIAGGQPQFRFRCKNRQLRTWREEGAALGIANISSAANAVITIAVPHPYPPPAVGPGSGVAVRVEGVVGAAPNSPNGTWIARTVDTTRIEIDADTSTSGGSGGTVTFLHGFGFGGAELYEGWPAGTGPAIYKYPIGSNPAWVLLDWLTKPYGLGNYFRRPELQLDLSSFRRWSQYCDQEIVGAGGIGRPRYRFDGTLDKQVSAWDYVTAILHAGGASLILRGRKIVVKYSYRDAHGGEDPSVADLGATLNPADPLYVPPRAVDNGERWEIAYTQIFCGGNLQNYRCQVVNTALRPTVIDVAILNRDIGYELDPIPVVDPHAPGLDTAPGTYLNAVGIIRESVTYLGVTRPLQARYIARFSHNVNRLSRTVVTFECGTDALFCEPGDIIGVQTAALKPRTVQRETDGSWQEGFALFTAEGWAGTQSALKLAGDILIPADEDWQAFVLDAADEVVHLWIAAVGGDRSFPAGSAIPIADPDPPHSSTTVELAAEPRPCAIGPVDRTITAYEIVQIDTNTDLVSTITAMEWHPEFYDLSGLAENEDSAAATDDVRSDALAPVADYPEVAAIRVLRTTRGSHRVTWRPEAGFEGRRARVFASRDDGETWQLLGETTSSTLETQLAAGPIRIAVSLSDALGRAAPLSQSTTAEVEVEECAPEYVPPVGGFRAETRPGLGALRFAWSPIQFDDLDYVEVREGPTWFESRVLGRSRAPFLWAAPRTETTTFLARARSKRTGLYSAVVATATGAGVVPDLWTIASGHPVVDLDGSAAGTHDGTEFDAGADRLQLVAGAHVGTYTMAEVDLGTAALRWWSVWARTSAAQLATIADADLAAGSGEARWWTPGGREPTPRRRGLAFEHTLGSLAGATIAAVADWDVHGPPGTIGHHTQVLTEVRYHDGTSYGAWGSYDGPDVRTAQKIQVRLVLHRRSEGYAVLVDELQVTAGE